VPAGPISGFFKGFNILHPLNSSEMLIIVPIPKGINFIKVKSLLDDSFYWGDIIYPQGL